MKTFSGPGSSCALVSSKSTVSPYESSIPNIDVCGAALGGITCPGAGVPPNPKVLGYYYRCCSSAGHCGPKNNVQDQSLYCGTGCRPGYGDCSTNRLPPPLPATKPNVAGNGETCGPIVNARCGTGLCCSGSNYCGVSLPSNFPNLGLALSILQVLVLIFAGQRIGVNRNGESALEIGLC